MRTIWEGTDRQGTKYFKHRPQFNCGHDIFVGDIVKRKKSDRVIRVFTAEVVGVLKHLYPKTIKVVRQ